MSPSQLLTPGFSDGVADLMHRSPGGRHSSLNLEVTEALLLRDAERAQQVLSEVRAMGVSVALDDFGGLSPLNHLDQFPIDTVKLDGSLVGNLAEPPTRAIARAITQLAHDLDILVVAEGVESARQYDQVKNLGCDYCQGYYFARPAPAPAIDVLMREPDPRLPRRT